MKTLPGTTADLNRHNAAYRVVWLVEVDADEPNLGTTTQFYAHRAFTLGANTYTDSLAAWPEFGWSRLRVGGGLSQVASLRLSLRNEDRLMQLVDTYFLENDEVRAYLVFADGSPVLADRVEMFRGVIEDLPYGIKTWNLDILDGSDKDFREIPQAKINLIDYVDASFDAVGQVVPEAFGNLNVGPHDNTGATPFMAPCRNTNIFTQEYTPGLRCTSYGDVFQYYSNAKRYAQVTSPTQNGGVFTVADVVVDEVLVAEGRARTMRLGGVLQSGTNDVSGYKAAMDGNSSNGVVIAESTEEDPVNLDLLIGGVPKLGSITRVDLVIDASGGYNYNALLGGVSKASGSTTGDRTINIASGVTDHADDWDFERYEIQIDGTGAATINQIYLLIAFDDQMTQDRQGLALFQKVTGWKDVVANYADGTAIRSGGALTNAADVLEAVLRGGNLMGMTEAEVNLTSFASAATTRSGWNVAYAYDTPVSIDWLNEYCFQMGLHLFKDFQGKWKVVAQDKSVAPVHTFLGDTHLATRGSVENLEPDVQYSRTPVRDLINEVALRYNLDRGTGEHTAVTIASGKARLTGTCSVSAATDKLTDGSATFNSGTTPAVVGDTVYVEGDKDYRVGAIDSDTVLSISVIGVGDVRDAVAGTNYFLGPNIDGRMVRSQTRYKTENPLGQRQSSIYDVGGYTSDIIADSTTADYLVEHLVAWRSQRRLQVEFATFLNAVDVELGDLAWFDQAWLPLSKKPVLIGTLAAGVNASVTTFTSADNGRLRDDDVILVDNETCFVSSVDYDTTNIVVIRADDNTVAAAHISGTAIYRLNLVRWEVVGLQPDPQQQQIRLQLQETPPSYQPVGVVSATGYPAYDDATAAQRAQSGWATLFSGRIKDEDEYSAISHVGPDSGTYTITQ